MIAVLIINVIMIVIVVSADCIVVRIVVGRVVVVSLGSDKYTVLLQLLGTSC